MNYLLVGASSAMAQHLTPRLLRDGHRVYAASRRPDLLDKTDNLHPLAFDAADPDATFQESFPHGLDGLVYFPGTITLKPVTRLTQEDFLHDFQINVAGAFKVIQQTLPELKKSGHGSVVLISSVAARMGMSFHASISAAKAAVEGMGRALAAELAPAVRVNIIAPSLTDTPLAESLLASEEQRDAARRRHPLRAIGSPADIAALAAFLLGPHARFMTGQVLRPDGGLSSVRIF